MPLRVYVERKESPLVDCHLLALLVLEEDGLFLHVCALHDLEDLVADTDAVEDAADEE